MSVSDESDRFVTNPQMNPQRKPGQGFWSLKEISKQFGLGIIFDSKWNSDNKKSSLKNAVIHVVMGEPGQCIPNEKDWEMFLNEAWNIIELIHFTVKHYRSEPVRN